MQQSSLGTSDFLTGMFSFPLECLSGEVRGLPSEDEGSLDRMTGTRLWKQYLPATSFEGGKTMRTTFYSDYINNARVDRLLAKGHIVERSEFLQYWHELFSYIQQK